MGSILVLGGAGYIGSHTVYELIDTGENVVIVDNLLTGFRKAVHPEAKFYQGDIRDRAFMDSVFENNILLTATERLILYLKKKISTVSFTLQQVRRSGKA